MTEKLLRECPFCGGDDLWISQAAESGQESDYGSIACHSCLAKGPHEWIDRPAIKAWNRRANPEAEALRFLENECLDLRCVEYPTGAGDADIGWQVVQHRMGKPSEIAVGEAPTHQEAIAKAREALAKGGANA